MNNNLSFKIDFFDGELTISFSTKIYADSFFADCYVLQDLCDNGTYGDRAISKIKIDLSNTFWFDTLAMCYLVMFVEVAYYNHKVEVMYEVSGLEFDENKKKFIAFLDDNGFLAQMKKIALIDCPSIPEMDYSDVHKCIWPLQIFCRDNITNNGIISSIELIKQLLRSELNDELSKNELAYTINKVSYFLQETLDNVYKHAYPNAHHNLTNYCPCALLIKRIKTVDLKSYNVQYTKNTPYINISLYEEKDSYLEIYVADVGIGIRRSFLQEPDGKDSSITDENILDYILSEGQRSHKKINDAETTKFGGLFDIVSMFKDDGDKLGIKGDSRWFFTPESKRIVSRINPQIFQNEYKGLAHGFAIVGSISWKNKTSTNYPLNRELRAVFKNYVNPLFGEKNPWMIKQYQEKITVLDCRFGDRRELINQNNIAVFLPTQFLSKSDIISMLLECRAQNIIVAGISEVEYKKYETLIVHLNTQLSDFITEKIILISNTFLPKIYMRNDHSFEFFIDETRNYITPTSENEICLSFLSFLLWKKVYDSELMWQLISRNNSQSYINSGVEWKNISLRGYLDFSQICLIKECRLLCFEWLMGFNLLNSALYFKSLDRSTDFICDQANHNMNNSPNNETFWIGSVFVSGTSARNISERNKNIHIFYFFKHADSVETNRNICSIFEWATNTIRIDKWFSDTDKKKNYKRVGNSSFVADSGTKYWIDKHFNNWHAAYQLNQVETYRMLQQQYGAHPEALKIGHMFCEDHHDLFEINTETLFYTDMVISKYVNEYQRTSYDYLLTQFIEGLLFFPKSTTLKNYLSSMLNSTQIGGICNKFFLHRKQKAISSPVEKHGLILYLNDYETSKVVNELKQLFSSEICSRIIPIIPIEQEYISSTLMISPLLLDNIQHQIDTLKGRNESCLKSGTVTVTIFISTSFTTRLQEELKYILLCMGATEVKFLSLIDRQRLPFGAYPKTQNHSFCRLDLPPIGFSNNCPLCKAIEILSKTKFKVRDGMINSRINEIALQWKSVKVSDNHFETGVSLEYINVPADIKSEISVYSQDKLNIPEINTNLGIALFAIENTSITLSTDFLDKCIASCDMDDNIKILLICTHLLVFNHFQVSEKHKCELIDYMLDILKKEETIDLSISSLMVVTLCGQVATLKKYTLEGIVQRFKDKYTPKSIDELIIMLVLYIEFQNDMSDYIPEEIVLFLDCYLKANKSKLDIIYDVFLYVEPEYVQSHRQAFSQILHTNGILDGGVYKKALDFTDKLKEIYEHDLLIALFHFHSRENYRKEQTLIIKHLNNLLADIRSALDKNIMENGDHERIQGDLSVLLDQLQRINKDLYLRVGDDEGIQNWLNKCELLAQERTKQKDNIFKSMGTYSVSRRRSSPDVRPWFYVFNDVTEEIINIMCDMMRGRSKKINNFIQSDDDQENEFDGLISVEYREYFTEISFYNITQNDKSIEEIRKIKNSKRNRPTTIIFNSFENRISELFGSKINCFEWNYAEEKFDLKLEKNEHLFQAILRIPYIDMGSSFVGNY